ncbi:RNA-binding protein [archaeon]|nr:RNA-binding protein [archaeon]
MRHLSNKEIKSLIELIPKSYSLDKRDEIVEKDRIIYRNSEKLFIILEKNKKEITKVIPHLKNLVEEGFKSVYVDHGAIPFIIKGADLMRPGIQKIEDFSKDEIILIKDEEHKKTIAVGRALFSSEEMTEQKKGISVKVLHFLGDEFY